MAKKLVKIAENFGFRTIKSKFLLVIAKHFRRALGMGGTRTY